MYPHERSLVQTLADKPFAIIGVNSDRDLEKNPGNNQAEKHLMAVVSGNGPQGTGGPISTRWGVTGWPTIYIIDAEGKIRYKNARGPKMDEALTELLAEMGHEVDLTNHEDPG